MSRILQYVVAGLVAVVFSLRIDPTSARETQPSQPIRPQLRLLLRSTDLPSKDGHIAFRGVAPSNAPYAVYAADNPVIRGHNVYAAKLLRTSDGWRCYYGGWQDKPQVHDKIYLSTSRNLDTPGEWSKPQILIENGTYEHVNDPTVAVDGDTLHMLYTAARGHKDPKFGEYFRDWINYSTSTDGIHWSPAAGDESTEIKLRDPQNLAGGTITSIARPSLAKSDTGWLLWFDANTQGQPTAGLHSFLARSVGKSPTSFEVIHRYPDIEGGPGFFEPDVVLRPDDTYLAVVQRHFGQLFLATSANGIHFDFHGPALTTANPHYKSERVSNPALLYDQTTGQNHGVAFGMASGHLTDHDIGFAFSQYIIQVRSPARPPNGQPVWHVYARSNGSNEQLVSVFNHDKFDLVRIIDPATGSVVLEQSFASAHPGDIWELEPTDRTRP